MIPHIPRKSNRNRKAPSHLQDFICQPTSSLLHSQELNKDKVYTKSGAPSPLCATLSYHKLSSNHKAFVTSISTHIEPSSYQQAHKCVEWRKAMQVEIDALVLNNTWVVTDLPPGKVAIGCKWIY